MKKQIHYHILGAILSLLSTGLLHAEDQANGLNVTEFLKDNPVSANTANTLQAGSGGLGGSAGLFPTTNALLNRQTTVTTTTKQQRPLPTTTISAPRIETNSESNVLPTLSQQRSLATLDPSRTNNSLTNATPLPDIKIPSSQEINEGSFETLKQDAFPLTPNQIRILHNMLDETQRATASEPFDNPPEPVSSSLVVNLSPGTTPPAVRLYRGFVSSLVFVDSTGAPWPIMAYDLGNPAAFNIAWNNKDNLLMVQALTSYNYGNLAVKLKDLDTPVMLTLIPGQRVVDYRVDLRIMERGPNAKIAYSGMNMPTGTSPILLNILDAIPPQGAKPLSIPDNTAQAWIYEDKVYLRTAYTLLSPAWIAKLSSADGMNAYELTKTPLVLLSRHGKTIQTKIEGF